MPWTPDISFYLSFHHPRRKADEVTAALRIDPERCWDKGSARNTYYGGALAGRNDETYWATSLGAADDYLGLDKAITALLDRLEPQRDFIASFAEAGRVELQVFWPLNSAIHTTLPSSLLRRLAEFAIGLEISPRV